MDEVKNLTFYWKKTCGAGPREGFSIHVSETPGEYLDDKATVVENGVARTHWDFEKPEKILSHSWDTVFLLSIEQEMGSQAYSTPVITCSDVKVLNVRALEAASGGGIVSEFDDFHLLKVLHTCLKTSGEARVTVEIALGSFDTVKFAWIKSCESSPTGFQISTELSSNAPDVVKDSVTLTPWNISNPVTKVASTETFTEFFIRYTGGEADISYPIVTAKPSHVLKASLSGDLKEGGHLKLDASSNLRVDYRCIQKGIATVKVTLVLGEHRHPIEYSWSKECPKFTRLTPPDSHTGFLTANRAMFLFCFVIVVVGALGGWTWIQYKKRKAHERKMRLQAQNYDS